MSKRGLKQALITRIDLSSNLKKGFTLVEVLIAIVIVGLGCVAVVTMQFTAIGAGSQADQLTVASFLAESQIEALRSQNFNLVALGSYPVENLTREGTNCTPGASQCLYSRTTTVTGRAPTSLSRLVKVQVSWRNVENAPRTVVYETAITPLGFGGNNTSLPVVP